MREFKIENNDSGQRLDKFLLKAIPEIPKGLLYKYIRTKKIKLNNKKTDGSVMLSLGDTVSCYINDIFFQNDSGDLKKYSFLNAPDKLEIIYEDENLLIVYKPAGLVVHADDHDTNDTLIARVLHYLYNKGFYSPDKEHSFTPALCNRLDRNTCGLVIAAKNAGSLREINRLIKDNKIHKSYLCITINPTPKKQDTIHAFHYKPNNSKTVKISHRKLDGYRKIITKYNTLTQCGRLSLVKIDLITGRTHQIRAHMSFVGAPLLGDDKYGNHNVNKQYNEKYQLLCAYKITFETERDSALSYLNGKRFTSGEPEFVKKYFPDFKL